MTILSLWLSLLCWATSTTSDVQKSVRTFDLTAPLRLTFTQQAPRQDASIEGVVTDSLTRGLVKAARITVVGGQPHTMITVISDSGGRFAVNRLSPGRYTISASKPGYVDATSRYDSVAGVSGAPIQLAAGSHTEIALTLSRGAVVTGSVMDESGEPVSGVLVRAFQTSSPGGPRVAGQMGTTTTDDRGIYRVYGLAAGPYVVCAMPRGVSAGVLPQASFSSDTGIRSNAGHHGMTGSREKPRAAGYSPVCYPGSDDGRVTKSIELSPGQERTGVDLQLHVSALVRLSGAMLGAVGERGAQVTLIDLANPIPGVGLVTTQSGPDGRFEFSAVSAGQYRLIAKAAVVSSVGGSPSLSNGSRPRPQTEGPQMDLVYGTTDVLVSDDDITDLSIALRPGQAVSGRVIFSGTRARVPTDLSRVVVSMVPEVTDLDPVATEVFTQPNQDGSFVIRNVLPGRYHLSAMAAGGWNLASARVGSHDTLDEPIVVTSGQNLSNAEIMFSDRATEFLGVVEDNSGTRIPGAIVVIYPSDNTQRRWTSRRIASTRSATDGAFVFRGLPPGEYRIAIAPETARTPIATSLLDELDSTASTVSLGDGIKTSGTIVRR